MIGTIIDGSYRVDRLIGEGSFGAVYECRELPLDRVVALKILKTNVATDAELRRFIAEGRNLASLNHPNVVQIYRLGHYESVPYIVMEFVRGTTLREYARATTLSLRQVLSVMHQVAQGLGAIHAIGIIHHDLSATNIFVSDSGTAKIGDFGLSRGAQAYSGSTSRSSLTGTLAYIAPEQIQGRGASTQGEVFAFGVILYEALAGRNPFAAEHHMALLFNITQREPEPITSIIPTCPPALALLLESCLDKQPDRRPASMAAVELSLATILATPGLDSKTPREAASVFAPRPTPRNPYLNRVMIKNREDFFGRAQDVKRIFARLNATPPGSISIVGDRKIGKSSLLNHIYTHHNRLAHLEQPQQMVMVFLDFQQEKNMSMESFVKALLGIANYELRGRLDVSDAALSLDGIKDMVQRLDAAGYRLAILLDEFEGITTNANFTLEFFSFLRYLANHYNVAYITSSARDLQVLCHTKEIADSPFFNIFSTMRLGAFQRPEAEAMIRVPSERVGKPLERHTNEIIKMAGLFPFFLQMACSHAVEYLDDHPDAQHPDFDEVGRRFYEEARLHYRYIWESFDLHERSTIVRVAKGRSLPDALRHVLVELEARHYVEADKSRPRLFASTFEAFVKAEAGSTEKRSLLSRVFGGMRG